MTLVMSEILSRTTVVLPLLYRNNTMNKIITKRIGEWKSIGKGADLCTNSLDALAEDYGVFYEHFTPLNTGVEPKDSRFKTTTVEPAGFITEVYKTENEEFSYILVHHFNDEYELVNEVFLRFKL